MLGKIKCEDGEDNPNKRNSFGGRGRNVHGILRMVILLSGSSKRHYVVTRERFSITTIPYTLSAPDHPHINITMDLLIDDNGGFPCGSW